MNRITDEMVNIAIERLAKSTGIKFARIDAYGYTQLAYGLKDGCVSDLSGGYGNTKRELYEKIHFALDIIGKFQINEMKKSMVKEIMEKSQK